MVQSGRRRLSLTSAPLGYQRSDCSHCIWCVQLTLVANGGTDEPLGFRNSLAGASSDFAVLVVRAVLCLTGARDSRVTNPWSLGNGQILSLYGCPDEKWSEPRFSTG